MPCEMHEIESSLLLRLLEERSVVVSRRTRVSGRRAEGATAQTPEEIDSTAATVSTSDPLLVDPSVSPIVSEIRAARSVKNRGAVWKLQKAPRRQLTLASSFGRPKSARSPTAAYHSILLDLL